MGAGTRRTPVQGVTGFPGQGAHELIAGWLQDKPASERWAVIVNGLAGLGALGRFAAPAEGRVEVLQVSGCGCCIAGPAFATTLGRLLKRGPWDLVILDASGQAHAGALIERVQGVGQGAELAVLPPILALDVTRAGAYIDERHAAHSMAIAWLELSPGRVLWGGEPVQDSMVRESTAQESTALDRASQSMSPRRASPGTALLPDRSECLRALEARLNGIAQQTGLPQRIWQTEDGHLPLAPLQAELAGALTLAETPGARRWDPRQVFDRPRLQTVLHALADQLAATTLPGTHARGVFRTERAWYAWYWSPQRVDWRESGWRMDSRVEVLVPDSVVPTSVGQGLLVLDAARRPD
jgi:hypothetical protein